MHSLDGYGGVARTISSKLNYLATHGKDLEIYVILFFHEKEFVFPLEDKVNLKIIGLNPFKSNPIIRPRIFQIIKRRIKAEINIINPDIVVSLASVKETMWLSNKNRTYKNLLEIHGNYQFIMERKSLRGRLSRRMILNNIRNSDAFVVLTERDAKIYKDKLDIHPQVIANPLPFEIKKVETEREKIVLAVGRLSEEKNFSSIIRIWSMVSPEFKDWKLKILGSGPLEKKLKEEVQKYNLSETVTIEYSPNIVQEYKKASIQVMTSLNEGLPMTLIEGTAFGLPAVSFDIDCGPSDVIQNGKSGFLIPPFNEEEFALKLRELMRNDSLRINFSKHSSSMAENFTIEKIMAKWTDLFRNLTK